LNIERIKKAIRARDGHRCTACGIEDAAYRSTYGRSLQVYRIPPATEYRLNDTCVTVCSECGARLRAAERKRTAATGS
jgi:hypothetical protein